MMHQSRRAFVRSAGRIAAAGAIFLLLPERLIRAAIRRETYLERAVHAMGTTVSVSAFGANRAQLLEATSAAFTELYRLERLLSVYDPSSDIGRLNSSAGQREVRVHADTWELLSRAKRYHAISGGAFDVTVEPLLERSGFRARKPVREQADAPLTIGDHHLHILKNTAVGIDHSRVKVDTGGIAVGYAVDSMVDVLRSFDIRTALINHGGDVYAMGRPEDTDGWEVVVPHPTDADEDLMSLFLVDRALSTSTNFRNTRETPGGRIGHIFDPATGENPAAYLSMSVMAASSCEADAMSTAIFVSEKTAIARSHGCDYVACGPGERLTTSLR